MPYQQNPCVYCMCLYLQVQQLILDPAIEHEFQQLRAQLALRVAETEAAKAAYEGQSFSQVKPTSHEHHVLLVPLCVRVYGCVCRLQQQT